MKKSYFRVAAMVAASVLSVSSFVSCDEEEENNSFKSETFTVDLIEKIQRYGFISGYTSIYEWEWTNSAEAAADSIDLIPNRDLMSEFEENSKLLPIDSFKINTSVDSMPKFEYKMHDTIKEIWTFKTKEIGVKELKFRKLRIFSGPFCDLKDIDELRRRAKEDPSAVVADTVVKF